MIKMYDRVTKFHEDTCENIEKFDEMLTQYGVDHAFMAPTEEEMNKDETLEGKVLYMQEDEMTFNLVTLLFCKTVLNKSDEEIKKTMVKVVAA